MSLIAFALIAHQAATQDSLQKPITFEGRAARASVLIPELAKAAGVTLEVGPTMANEVLVISAKSLPLQTLLDKIGIVTSGEWQQDGATLRLIASTTARNREAREETALRLASIRKAIADRLKPPAPKKGDMENVVAFGGDPDTEISQLLKGLDPTPMAMLNAGERVVYSTAPTQMQRPLMAGAPAIIAALVKRHNDMVAKTPKDEPNEIVEKMPDFFKDMIAKRTSKIVNPQKALLIVSKTGLGITNMTQLELRIYDGEGKVAYSTTSMLGNFMDEMGGMDFQLPGQPAKAPKAGKATDITYSADSKALLSTFQGATFSGGMTIKLDPKLKEKLSRPDVTDPLSFMATDELFSLAKLKNKSLVAAVPDSLMGSLNFLVPNAKQSVEDFEADLAKGKDATLSETETCLVVKPARPSDSRAERTDRIGLATIVKAANTKGVPSLDDIAAYAQTSPSPTNDGVGMLYAMLLVPGLVSQGLDGMTDWNMLRFYGSLGLSQRQNLLQGGTITVSAMTSAQQSLWRKMVFGVNSPIRTGDSKVDEGPFSMAMSMAMMGGGGGDFRNEPTELMPTGLPGAAPLTLKATSEPMASPVSGGDNTPMGFIGVMGADEIAMFKMLKEDPNMAALSGFMPQLEKLKIGERNVLKFTLGLPRDAYVSQTLHDNRMPANAVTASLSDLPAPFQKLVAERMEVLKKSPFGSIGAMMGAMGGQRTIKP